MNGSTTGMTNQHIVFDDDGENPFPEDGNNCINTIPPWKTPDLSTYATDGDDDDV